MDSRLQERLSKWHDQINSVSGAEKLFLSLEAEEKPLWSQLFLNAVGKNVSEREALAYTHSDWRDFQGGLVEAKVAYNREKRILDLKQSAFTAEYLAAKTEAEAIQRYPKHGL